MQVPSPSVPFVEYVLKAIEHPPCMFVSKLAACCTMLFLTRSNPELLRKLCLKWALRFQMDRERLIGLIRRRSAVCQPQADGRAAGRPGCSNGSNDSPVAATATAPHSQQQQQQRGEPGAAVSAASGLDPSAESAADLSATASGGLQFCNADEAVEHFLKILNSLVSTYFSWNWHRTDYVIQVNREYIAYVQDSILPICEATPVEDGIDDVDEMPWLLCPKAYLPASSQSVTNFYSPVGRYLTRRLPSSDLPSVPANTEQVGTSFSARAGGSTTDDTDSDTGPGSHFADRASSVGSLNSSKFATNSATGTALSALPRSTEEHKTTTTDREEPQAASVASSSSTAGVTAHSTVSRQTNGVPVAPNSASRHSHGSLTFITLANYFDTMTRNENGLVIVFHAKYSVKSNEALEVCQQLMQRSLLTPMPDFAVVYTVAEPELASLYNVSWFPTIVYVPPRAERLCHAHRRGEKEHAVGNSSAVDAAPAAQAPGKGIGCDAGAVADASSVKNDGAAPTPRQGKGVCASPTLASAVAAERSASIVPRPPVPSPTQVLYGFSVPEEVPSLSGSTTGTRVTSPNAQGAGLCFSGSGTAGGSAHASPDAANGLEVCDCPRAVGAMTNGTDHSEHAVSGSGSVSGSSLSFVAADDAQAAEQLQELVAADGHQTFPMNGAVSVSVLAEWIASGGKRAPSARKSKDYVTRVDQLRNEQKYQKFRELHSAVVMLRRLQSGKGSADYTRRDGRVRGTRADDEAPGANVFPSGLEISSPTAAPCNEEGGSPSWPSMTRSASTLLPSSPTKPAEPPLFIFLGGGMAAGKSTAAMALAHSNWWRRHKDQSVLVNADEFKVIEPTFDGLEVETHSKSTRVAESLLVQAINQGRSIVFDGTMMWAPFVLQVIEMVRHAHLTLYKQGPGYRGPSKPEKYFVPSAQRATPLPKPYVIRFLGITLEPEIAVLRGFLRKFSTGRGVPISTQLKSFKLFAENFPLYASLMDSVTLYNNNVYVALDNGELPPIIAERVMSDKDSSEAGAARELKIHDEVAYQLFLRQRTLNEEADNVLEIYPATKTPHASQSPEQHAHRMTNDESLPSHLRTGSAAVVTSAAAQTVISPTNPVQPVHAATENFAS